MELKLLDAGSIYKGFEYPKEFLKIVHLGLTDFDFWYLMDYDQAAYRIKSLQERYPDRKLVPFARRGDNDDIVCFDIDRGGRVQKIHDFVSSGWEQRKDYESFWDWFREAIDEMIEEVEYDEIIDSKRAYDDGVVFYHGNEKVWLADKIPPCYIREL